MSTKEVLLSIIHANFEILLVAWVRGRHDPETETLVFRPEGITERNVFKGEYWSLGRLQAYLGSIGEGDEVIHHLIVAEGVERGVPIVIFPALPVMPDAGAAPSSHSLDLVTPML